MALMVCVLLLLVLFNVVTPAGYKNIAKLSDFSYVLNKELLHLSLSSECNTKVMKPEGYKIPALDGDAVADSRDVGGGAGGHGAEVFPRSANVPQEVEEKLTYLPFDPERLIPFKVETRLPDKFSGQDALIKAKLNECSTTSLKDFKFGSSTLKRTISGARRLLIMRGRRPDKNTYHSLHMDMTPWCAYLHAGIEHSDSPVDLYFEIGWEPVNKNVKDLMVALVKGNGGKAYFESSIDGATKAEIEANKESYSSILEFREAIHTDMEVKDILFDPSNHIISTFPLWNSFAFEKNRLWSPFATGFVNVVKRAYGITDRTVDSGVVLVVDRKSSRNLGGFRVADDGGMEWGKIDFVLEELQSRGLPVEYTSFSGEVGLDELVQKVARAKVFVAVHGAGMSHAMWMKPGSTVVEVINRHDTSGYFLPTGYHKADFANLARTYGMTYFYKDSEAITVPRGTTEANFNWWRSYVNVEQFADEIECAFWRGLGAER